MSNGPADAGTSDFERGTSTQPYTMGTPADAGTALPAGTLNPYDISGKVIVADELSRGMTASQITESDFWMQVSTRIADRIQAVGGDADAQVIRQMMIAGRRILVGESQVWNPIDPWILDRLGLQPPIAPDDVVSAVVARPLVELPAGLQALADVGGLSDADVALRYTCEGENEIEQGPDAPGQVPTAAGLSLPPAPPQWFTPTSAEGRAVHLEIQQHYLRSHPNNTVMFENQILWPGGSASIQALGAIGAVRTDFALIRFALMTQRGLTKLPDILDVTLGEVYEIKPRAQAQRGIRQLSRNYLGPLSQAGLVRYRPGESWQPLPVYPVPPVKLALVCQPAPGLIVYDLVPLPPPPPVPETDTRWLWGAVAVACAIAAAAIAIPTLGAGDVALGAAIAAMSG